MQPRPRRARGRRWFALAALLLAVLIWAPGQLWSQRRLLFWACLIACFLLFLACVLTFDHLRRRLTHAARAAYLWTAFRLTRRSCGPR